MWQTSVAPKVRNIDRLFFKLMLTLGVAITISFAMWWLKPEHVGNKWLYVLFTVLFGYSVLRLLYNWYVYTHINTPEQKKAPEGLSVAIFTTSYKGEPIEMVERTLKACARVNYPHTTYLLDNTEDPQFKEVAERNGAVWLDMVGTTGAKAGKINKALSLTKEEFILVLDPDHMPFPDFFEHTLGYFEDPEVGFVQVSQGYYNQYRSFVAKGAAEQSYMFYGPVQMSYSQMGAAIAIGANCTFRRKAFDSIGGHVIGLAEDLQTSLKLHSAGWKSVYNPVIANRGIVPEDFDSFAKQQLKWARGALGVLVEDLPSVFKKLNFKQKLVYSAISTYYLTGLVNFLFIMFPFFFFMTGMIPLNMSLAAFAYFGLMYLVVSSLEYYLAAKYVCHPSERYFHWRSMLLKFATWPIYFYAFVLMLFDKKIPYIPTSKQVGAGKSVMAKPHLFYSLLVGLSLAGVFVHRYLYQASYTLDEDAVFTWSMAGFTILALIMSIISIIIACPPMHLLKRDDTWNEIVFQQKEEDRNK